MGLRIATNATSLTAQRTLRTNNREQANSITKLSSGSRITRSADDSAGLAISEKLRSHIRGLQQAGRNTGDAISMIQIAEGGLTETSNILVRMRELAVQSASDTVGLQEKGLTDLEFQNLKEEVDRISQVTEFNGRKLINGGERKYDVQVGINNNEFEDRITFDTASLNASTDGLGVSGLAVNNKEGALDSLGTLDDAIQKLAGQRAELGAKQNRLSSTNQNIEVSAENLSAANSRIRDTDYAMETARNTKYNILTNAGTAVLLQANSQGQAALKLIG